MANDVFFFVWLLSVLLCKYSRCPLSITGLLCWFSKASLSVIVLNFSLSGNAQLLTAKLMMIIMELSIEKWSVLSGLKQPWNHIV